jgi:hypothetical protein
VERRAVNGGVKEGLQSAFTLRGSFSFLVLVIVLSANPGEIPDEPERLRGKRTTGPAW